MEQFALFCREQLHTQTSSVAKGGGDSEDLVTYVEKQRSYRCGRGLVGGRQVRLGFRSSSAATAAAKVRWGQLGD